MFQKSDFDSLAFLSSLAVILSLSINMILFGDLMLSSKCSCIFQDLLSLPHINFLNNLS